MKFLLLILLPLLAQAETFRMAGTMFDFSEKEGLLLHGCSKKCDALKEITKHKKINLKEVRKGMEFTNSIGSDVCSRVYKADAIIGIAENKDQRAFCVFKDKSMVEMNSLSQYLQEKKFVRE